MKKHTTTLSLILVFLLSLSLNAHAGSIWTPFTDTVNSGIINTKMMSDKSLSGTEIDATVIDGIAVFSGHVDSKAQLEQLNRIALSVSGVKGVNISKVKVGQQNNQQ